MTAHIIDEVFAWTPMTVFMLVLVTAYVVTRGRTAVAPEYGRTYACASCGRRGRRDQMVPVTHEGAVVWYCGRCAT